MLYFSSPVVMRHCYTFAPAEHTVVRKMIRIYEALIIYI